MGFNHNVGFWAFFIFFLLSIITSFFASPSSSLVIKPADAPSSLQPAQYQEFKIKNPRSLVLNEELRSRKKRRKKIKNFGSRSFSAMLPKGFVPPSGSSPCHNDVPDSLAFYCEYYSTTSNTKP
uniref:Uncharacterized protein n=1 Tax=Nelumbo nucifera TaxID=4432 RepID=A0A822Z1I6_NELNU|nr:TPA_asm: hypothetical protein HUJ06_008182 [Nelumbo nucifera]